ncbi:excalibur calcium-binding domain-containing protein [Pseudarthrobacter phenanthrenivorans]|uniref:excalibur calcium-binding domain-containing protein n=1 Tax=Pseudarthrobacter phenanthrenivorans TaxID=361575 RepID=UPI00287806C8|nr:excalibur calcium-binding domain-containing protein [Pseudarthrobacter phenanthrenivorans]
MRPTDAATAVAAVEETAVVPGVVGLALDKATEQLEGLGFKVEAEDAINGKTIMVKKNWQVESQDPGDGVQLAKGSTVRLGVRSLDDIAAEKAAAEKAAAEQAAAEAAAAKAAAEKAAADKAAADKAAADKAAADKAAADAAAAQQAAKVAPAPVAPAPAAPAPSSVYYANCAAAKAAGAAPLLAGQPGYRPAMDGDSDGVACER